MVPSPPPGRARPAPLAALLLAGAAACGASGAASTEPADFDEVRAWRDLEALVAIGPRPAGSPGAEQARRYIEAQLAEVGLEPRRETFRAPTPDGPIEFANVVVDVEGRPGKDGPAPMVVIGSHYETKRFDFHFVGANDGGSSTAVLLELARVLAASRPGPLTWRLLFLDGEESIGAEWIDPDNRYGSRHHVRGLRESGELDRVRAFVLIDLVGDRDLRLTRDSYSDASLVEIFERVARENGLAQHVFGPAQRVKDDHLSFLEADVPSIDLIDLDYGPRNRWWHSPEDTLDKCAPESLEVVGRLVLLSLPELERSFR